MAAKFSVSAPGKIILHGEHSVVYGKKAIACAIGSRVVVDAAVSPQLQSSLVISMPSVHLNEVEIIANLTDFEEKQDIMEIVKLKCNETLQELEHTDFARIALSCILYAYYHTHRQRQNCGGKGSTVAITISSDIPIGAGLGSSAAFNTSIACLFLIISGSVTKPGVSEKFSKISNENHLNAINSLAFELEKIVHKTPSGIDNSIATFGGAVSFQNGDIIPISKMPTLQLLIVDTKITRSTKTLVSKVKEYADSHPDVVLPIMESLNGIATCAESLLGKLSDDSNNAQLLSVWCRLITTNQSLLKAIGVSHCALDKICFIANKYGCPAKLTGAGGGGCAIVVLDYLQNNSDSISQLGNELEMEGFGCIRASLGGNGVLVKSTQVTS